MNDTAPLNPMSKAVNQVIHEIKGISVQVNEKEGVNGPIQIARPQAWLSLAIDLSLREPGLTSISLANVVHKVLTTQNAARPQNHNE